MDGLTIFICLISILWSILCIILFFKIWAMTSDVAEIKQLLQRQFNQQGQPLQAQEETSSAPKAESPFKKGDAIVELATGQHLELGDLNNDGRYTCYKKNGFLYGRLSPEEFVLEADYKEKNK